jgi:hypothetical protein
VVPDATLADPDNPGGLPPGESVDAPAKAPKPDEPTR